MGKTIWETVNVSCNFTVWVNQFVDKVGSDCLQEIFVILRKKIHGNTFFKTPFGISHKTGSKVPFKAVLKLTKFKIEPEQCHLLDFFNDYEADGQDLEEDISEDLSLRDPFKL